MHSPDVLKHYGLTPERLREIFTSTGPSGDAAATKSNGADSGGSSPEEAITTAGVKTLPYTEKTTDPQTGEPAAADPKQPTNWEIRRRFEFRIRSRVLNGIATGINNARPLQAVDIAWDAPPIQKETLPLLLWAQGKIKNDGLCDYFARNCSAETTQKFFRKNIDQTITVNLPRICDVSVGLVRSYVTRRHAAIAALWDNLWPLFKYDPRGTDETASLIGDATTQRIDIMGDEYNYRHFLSQCDRDKLLYAQSLAFPRSAWDRQWSVRRKSSNVPGSDGKDDSGFESYITQEGVDFVNPHPSRWFYDLGAPLANINTNNGPGYIGYWDIVPYSTILKGNYYNVQNVVASEAWIQLVQQQGWYFAQYFDPCVLAFPTCGMNADPALMNDRTGNIGLYTAELADKGVLLSTYLEKINPKAEGICRYDADIWLRLIAAGDGTIVGAEAMPSLPACYGGINVNDNRLANASLASEMLTYQDMCSNIVSHMIQQLRVSFMMLVLLDEDSLDPAVVAEIKKSAGNMEWWMDPKFLTYSATKLKELGISDPRQAFAVVQAQVSTQVSDSLKAIAQVLALADRLVNSSPNELGQPNPREVSARETQEISTTVQSIYAFYNEGPREQRAAFKRLVYESLMCHGAQDFAVPVIGRYKLKTVEEAGFKLETKAGFEPDTLLKSGVRITGKLTDLDFDFVYTSRDGAERPLNTQGAQVLQQFLVGLLQIPGVPNKLGFDRIANMLNIVGRMAGAPDEFRIAVNDGDEGPVVPPDAQTPAPTELPPQAQQQIAQLMVSVQAALTQNQQLAGIVQQIAAKIGFVAPPQVPAGTVPATNGGLPAPGVPTAGGPPAPAAAPASSQAILQGP